jgi:hypothetical protein
VGSRCPSPDIATEASSGLFQFRRLTHRRQWRLLLSIYLSILCVGKFWLIVSPQSLTKTWSSSLTISQTEYFSSSARSSNPGIGSTTTFTPTTTTGSDTPVPSQSFLRRIPIGAIIGAEEAGRIVVVLCIATYLLYRKRIQHSRSNMHVQ